MDPITLSAGAIVGLAVLWFLFSSRGGGKDSAAVQSVLEKLGPDYEVMRDIVLSTPDGMLDIDYAVVSPFGVFIVNERLEPGRVNVSTGRREWTVSHFRHKDSLYNPLWRNRKVINYLREKVGEVPMISLVVFVNARLGGTPDSQVVTLKNLVTKIKSHTYSALSEEQRKKVLNVLGKRSI
jgi:hypothetical protein